MMDGTAQATEFDRDSINAVRCLTQAAGCFRGPLEAVLALAEDFSTF